MTSHGATAATLGDPGSAPSGLTVDVDVRAEGWRADVDDPETVCVRAAEAAFGRAAESRIAIEVAIVLADDAFLAELNGRYRGKDGPTNVLSFPGDMEATGGAPALLGDIAVAHETVVREARAEGKTAGDRLAHMIVHGMLHLLGHDHEDDGEAAAMEALEAAILGELGIGDPYYGNGD